MTSASLDGYDARHLTGAFDIIGDVHGCATELEALLANLGHTVNWLTINGQRTARVTTAHGRRVVLVGDLVDRGPKTPDAIRIAMALVTSGHGFCVPGNHDDKFRRWLAGNKIETSHGIQSSIEQMQSEPPSFHQAARNFIATLPPYLWLDGGKLIVAHAGLRADMIGNISERIRRFCLYGDTDGKTDADGYAIRYDWAARYDGTPLIVYGHTPVLTPVAKNNTICIDTGCCFGNTLTALRYPEMTYVTVSAPAPYYERSKLFGLPPPRA